MLIILSKSPWTENYGSILEIARKTVENGQKTAVLYIQDACIAATMNGYCDKLFENKIDVYALKADCEARGLMDKLRPRVKVIDYEQWVKLVMMHDKIVSWTI
jgi:tRNA 2-thiouridine synthesizing protein B